jgi:hypothetical protein
MKKLLLLFLSILCFTSCSTTHHHHHYPNDEAFVKGRNITSHQYADGDHTVIVINHHRHLKRHEKKMLKRWFRHHHGIRHNRIRYRFVMGI